MAGSVTVGDYCVFAGQSGVVGHIRIGNNCRIGAQSGVVSDVADGTEVLGSPASVGNAGRRVLATIPHLPQMRSVIRRLTREVNALKKRLGIHGHEDRE